MYLNTSFLRYLNLLLTVVNNSNTLLITHKYFIFCVYSSPILGLKKY